MALKGPALELTPTTTKEEELRQVAFVFDPVTGETHVYHRMNTLAEAAARLFGR